MNWFKNLLPFSKRVSDRQWFCLLEDLHNSFLEIVSALEMQRGELQTLKGELKRMADNTDAVLKPIADALVALQTELQTHNTVLGTIEQELVALAAAGAAGTQIDPAKVQAIADAVGSVTKGLSDSDATIAAAVAAAQNPTPVTPAPVA